MTWAVPETQMEPLGLRTRWQAASHWRLKAWLPAGPGGFAPIAFGDGDHFAGVAGDAAVGEEVGRVGEDEVDGIFGDGVEDFEAVALVDADLVLGVVEGEMPAECFAGRRPGLRNRGRGTRMIGV